MIVKKTIKALFAGFFFTLMIPAFSFGQQFVYLDSTQPISYRVEDLLSRMTLKEKLGQLNLPCVYVNELGKDISGKLQAIPQFTAGTYTNEIGPGSGFFTLANEVLHDGNVYHDAQYFNELQKIAVTQTRLKIPLLEDEEGTHGAMYPGATVFPEGLAIGSSFDLALVRAIYSASASEARAVGINMLSTLVMELDRDPRMGRNEEGYTEDPYVDSRIGESIVQATQGNNLKDSDKVIAVLTDFPTQSSPVSGLERGAIESSDRSLYENDLLPWKAVIKAGGLGIMAGYPDVDDVPTHGSEKWLNNILREELGFRGVVESEGGGFQTLIDEHIVPNQKEAGAVALKAGVDLDITYEPAYMGLMVENVEEGRVPMFLVDRAVRRVLKLKFSLGLFENPYVNADRASRIVHSQKNQGLALRAAREGIVLLKNKNNILPLRKNLKSIAIIGPDADNERNQLGDYIPNVIPQHVETILDGIKSKVTSKTKVTYVRGCNVIGNEFNEVNKAKDAAKKAEIAIVVVGENERETAGEKGTDGEGKDVASLDLTGRQEELVEAVYKTGTPTIVVLINGRPLSTRWISKNIPGIIDAWNCGEKGGDAVADVLFGDYNPSGKLPVTIPRSSGQLPVYYNYKPTKTYWMNRGYADMPGTPLYPFGYGLSYTRYSYSNLSIQPAVIHPGGEVQVSADIKNTGDRAGVETVELYVHETYAPVSLPVKQLRGFKRVALKPGETKTVSMTLTSEDLQLLDKDMHWRVVPGDFEIMVGKSSSDIPLQGILKVRQ